MSALELVPPGVSTAPAGNSEVEYNSLPPLDYSPEYEHASNLLMVQRIERKPGLYQRNGRLGRLVNNNTEFEFVPLSHMRDIAITVSRFERYNMRSGKGEPCAIPRPLIDYLSGAKFYGAPQLTKIVDTPQLGPGPKFKFQDKPGYDAETRCYLNPRFPSLSVPGRVTLSQAAEAFLRLVYPVDQMPFLTDSDKSAWAALTLTLLARPAFACAPMFVIAANRMNTGKTLSMNLASMIALGRTAGTTPYPHNDEELTKLVGAWALRQSPLEVFDNTDTPIGSPVLESILTNSGVYGGRILGKNATADVPLSTVIAMTANRPIFKRPDIVRRTIPIRLEVVSDLPEDKPEYRHTDILAYVRERREHLLHDALTLLAGYVQHGCPKQSGCSLDSFEEWSNLICGAIVWAGFPNPLDTQKGLKEDGDESDSTFKQFFLGIETALAGGCLTAKEILAKARGARDTTYAGLWESFGHLGMGKTGDVTAQELGIRLQKNTKVPFGRKRIELAGTAHGGARRWQIVEKVKP